MIPSAAAPHSTASIWRTVGVVTWRPDGARRCRVEPLKSPLTPGRRQHEIQRTLLAEHEVRRAERPAGDLEGGALRRGPPEPAGRRRVFLQLDVHPELGVFRAKGV